MFPTITLFGRTITTYALLAMIGAFAAGILVCRLAKKRGENDNDAIVIMLFSTIGVFVGGHLLYGITNWAYLPRLFEVKSLSQFLAVMNILFGGSVFYGGLIGAIAVGCLTVRIKKRPLPLYADMLATAIPLFHGFARIGCFLGGCCYGIESSFGWTAHGNTLVPSLNDVSRFPVQLLEAGLNFLLFAALYGLYKHSLSHPAWQGKLMFTYLLSYSGIRFGDEFLRGDDIRGFILGLSTSQFISLLLFGTAAAWLIVLKIRETRRATAPEAANEGPLRG